MATLFIANRKVLVAELLSDSKSRTLPFDILQLTPTPTISSSSTTANSAAATSATVFARQTPAALSEMECQHLTSWYVHCRAQWDNHEQHQKKSCNSAHSSQIASSAASLDNVRPDLPQMSIDPTLHESRGLTANDAGLREWCREHIVIKQCVPLLQELFFSNNHITNQSTSNLTPAAQQPQQPKPPIFIDTNDFYAFFLEGSGDCDSGESAQHGKDVHVDESVVTFLFTLHIDASSTLSPPVLEVECPYSGHGSSHTGVVEPNFQDEAREAPLSSPLLPEVERIPLAVGGVVCFPGMLPHKVIEAENTPTIQQPSLIGPTTALRRLQLVVYTKPICPPKTRSISRFLSNRKHVKDAAFYEEYEWYLSQKYLKAAKYSNGLALSFSIPSMPEWCRNVGLKWIQHLTVEKNHHLWCKNNQHQQLLVPLNNSPEISEEQDRLRNSSFLSQEQQQPVVPFPVVKAATHFSQVSELLEMIIEWCGPHRGADQISMSEVCVQWNRALVTYWDQASPVRWEQRRVELTQKAIAASSSSSGDGGGGRQHVVISLGGLGNATAAYFWESIAAGAGLDTTGRRIGNTSSSSSTGNNDRDDVEDSFFREVYAGQYRPRGVLIDTSSCWDNPSDELLCPSSLTSSPVSVLSKWRHLFAGNQRAFGKEAGTGHIWAEGRFNSNHHSVVDEAIDAIRRQVEACSSMAGFIMLKGVGGGTCGIASRLDLAEHFPRKTKIGGATITPSFTLDKYSHTAAYNACLALGGGHGAGEMDSLGVSVLYGNGALHRAIAQSRVGGSTTMLYNPYKSCQVASRCLQSITTSMRLDGALNVDVNEFVTNHVPYPRVHFLTIGHAPLYEKRNTAANDNFEDSPSVAELCNRATDFHNHLHSDLTSSSSLRDTSSCMGKYMAMSLLFHGNVAPKDVMAAVSTIKTKRTLQFVDWCPTGFKCGIQYGPLGYGPSSCWSSSSSPQPPVRSVTSISNTTAISDVFSKMHHRASTLYSKRSFVHHYVAAGMEEGEMSEALENLVSLEKDYEEVGAEAPLGDNDQDEYDEY